MYQQALEDVALFFDFENIAISLWKHKKENPDFQKIMDFLGRYGRLVMARAYADWVAQDSFVVPLRATGFSPIYVPTYTNGKNGNRAKKNAVDMQIAVEATDTLRTHPNINTFVLLTGDKDYLPLVHKLRSQGKTVIALAVKDSVSQELKDAVDEMVYYRQILTDKEETNVVAQTQKVPAVFANLIQAVKEVEAAGKRTILTRIKQKMVEMLGSFDERKHKKKDGTPFSRFLEFVQEAERLGIVALINGEKGYEVKLA